VGTGVQPPRQEVEPPYSGHGGATPTPESESNPTPRHQWMSRGGAPKNYPFFSSAGVVPPCSGNNGVVPPRQEANLIFDPEQALHKAAEKPVSAPVNPDKFLHEEPVPSDNGDIFSA
jgi:hypothetical protein